MIFLSTTPEIKDSLTVYSGRACPSYINIITFSGNRELTELSAI